MSQPRETQREAYIDLMTEPIQSGLGSVEGVLEPGEDPMLSVSAAIDLVMPHIMEVDWEGRAEAPPIGYTAATHLDAHERSRTGHAERLVSAAFNDAQFLLTYAEYAAKRQQLPEDVSFGRLLLDSEGTLLQAARIPDKSKEALFRAISMGGDFAKFLIGRPIKNGPFILRDGIEGRPILDWEPEIKAWIQDNMQNGDVCPAHMKIIEADGRKMTLMHFFWDKLVRAAYEV